MIFNPVDNGLYSNEEALIKKLYCPLNKKWENLEETSSRELRMCSDCRRNVVDTALYNENEIHEMIKKDTGLCLKINLSQSNIRVKSWL